MRLRHLIALAVPLGLLLTGCRAGGTTDGPTIVAAFYPLAYAAEQIAGDGVEVIDLTPPGAEPHDLELTAQQVAQIAQADLVLYIPGFQPAVDEAIAQQAGDRAVDVTQGIAMLPDGDPHVWLNPLNMVSIGQQVATRLGGSIPGLADTALYNQQGFDEAMHQLNDAWAAGTAQCQNRDLVVSHQAFAYLADQYDFTQVAIAGLSPDAEPSPERLAEVAAYVHEHQVSTIYYETLVDPKVAETIAAETGAQTAVLDPLEGLQEGYDGDYVTVMQENLDTVRAGQGCTS